MKRDLVLWTGPVAPFQVPEATLYPDPDEPMVKHIGCLGDREPNCVHIADSLLDADGRRIPRLFARMGVDPAEVRDFVIGAFSAGGALVKRLLYDPRDRAMVRAVMLSDATYTGWDKQGNARPIPGFSDLGVDIANGSPQMLVATSSTSPNFSYPNGVQGLMATMADIEARAGKRFERGPWLDHIDPPPTAAYKRGDVIFGDYQMILGHNHPRIAGQLWQSILWPWLRQLRALPTLEPPPIVEPPAVLPPSEPALLGHAASLLLGAAVGYLGVRTYQVYRS